MEPHDAGDDHQQRCEPILEANRREQFGVCTPRTPVEMGSTDRGQIEPPALQSAGSSLSLLSHNSRINSFLIECIMSRNISIANIIYIKIEYFIYMTQLQVRDWPDHLMNEAGKILDKLILRATVNSSN